jgi:hypothetical protein
VSRGIQRVVGRRGGAGLVGHPRRHPLDDAQRTSRVTLDPAELGRREALDPIAGAVAARQHVGEPVTLADRLVLDLGEHDLRLVRHRDVALRRVEHVQPEPSLELDDVVRDRAAPGNRHLQVSTGSR